MFNTLASYLFGGKNNSTDIQDNNNSKETAEVVKGSTVAGESSHSSTSAILQEIDESLLNLTTVCPDEEDDEDHDWLLVEKTPIDDYEDDKEDSVSRTDSEGELPLVPINYFKPLHLRKEEKDDDIQNFHQVITSNLPALFPNSMEESWFVTPPSCFVSQGPIQLETSPLENLLIEHPSMSVYCSFRGSSLHAVGDSVLDDNVVLEVTQEGAQRAIAEIRREPPRYNGLVRRWMTIRSRNRNNRNRNNNSDNRVICYQQQVVTPAIVVRATPIVQEVRKHHQKLGKTALDRSNKNHKVNGRNGRQKRADFQSAKLSSRANNNRKC